MNYDHLTEALSLYQTLGYSYIQNAPWYVGREAYYATRPDNAQGDVTVEPHGKYLVASGEQSFLQMMFDGHTIGQAVCITPCFRLEEYDDLHQPNFMKVELIETRYVCSKNVLRMIRHAQEFFERYLNTKVVPMGPDMYDIIDETTGIELGSYGIRGYGVHHWIYGTGCAEPRLSYAYNQVPF